MPVQPIPAPALGIPNGVPNDVVSIPEMPSIIPSVPMTPANQTNMPVSPNVELIQGQEQIASISLPPVVLPDGMTTPPSGTGFPDANIGNQN